MDGTLIIFCAVWIQLAIFVIGFTYLFLILYLNKLHYLEINVSETFVVCGGGCKVEHASKAC
jgi:hypothetical protein